MLTYIDDDLSIDLSIIKKISAPSFIDNIPCFYMIVDFNLPYIHLEQSQYEIIREKIKPHPTDELKKSKENDLEYLRKMAEMCTLVQTKYPSMPCNSASTCLPCRARMAYGR